MISFVIYQYTFLPFGASNRLAVPSPYIQRGSRKGNRKKLKSENGALCLQLISKSKEIPLPLRINALGGLGGKLKED